MVIQSIYLDMYDWFIKIFYNVDLIWFVLDELEAMGASNKFQKEAIKNLCIEDNGLIYSDIKHRCSIIALTPASSTSEFQNTLDHEKSHLAVHIAKSLNIDINSEEFNYLFGEIGEKMYKTAKLFLCEDCKDSTI